MKGLPVGRCLKRSRTVALTSVFLIAAGGCGSTVADFLEDDRYPAVTPESEQADLAHARRQFQEQVQAVRCGASTRINVEDPGIEDSDLAALRGLLGLTELSLPAAHVSDAGVRCLKNLPAIEVVVLGDTTCTDDACQIFATLKELRVLNLNASRITSTGLAHLKALRTLENFRLGSSHVTEISALSELPGLRFLILQMAAIHDKALAKSDGFEQLESLYLEGNPLTDDGVAVLAQRRPELHIHW